MGFEPKIGPLSGIERLDLYNEATGNAYITPQQIADLVSGSTTGSTVGDTSVLTDNGNGTYTHNDGEGNLTIIDTRANSNPYDNTVVNILTGSTVQQAIDELASIYTEHIDGNILWVSSEGNNTDAEKGNMEKPYADPWTARDNAIDGDTVIVLDGQWTFGPTGSSADYESTLDGVNLFSGFTDGQTINYHFGHGTSLTKVGNDFSGGPQALFYTNNAITSRVTGNLTASWNSITLQNSTIVHTENQNSNLYFEFAQISYQTFGIAFYQGNNFTAKINKVTPFDGSVGLVSFRERSTTTGVTFNLYVDEYFGEETDYVGLIGNRSPSGSNYVQFDNSNFYCEFNNIYKSESVETTPLGPFGYIFGLLDGLVLNNSNFTIKANNVQHVISSGTLTNPTRGYFDTLSVYQPSILFQANLNNSHVEIDIDSMVTDFNTILIDSSVISNTTGYEYSTTKIKGNYTCNNTATIILRSGNGNDTPATNYITFDGRFISNAKNVISDVRTNSEQSPITFKGYYRTFATGETVASIRNTLSFDKAVLIVEDTNEPDIETDNGTDLDINVMKSYSNTLVEGINIIERVSPIRRDSAVKN